MFATEFEYHLAEKTESYIDNKLVEMFFKTIHFIWKIQLLIKVFVLFNCNVESIDQKAIGLKMKTGLHLTKKIKTKLEEKSVYLEIV